MRIVALPSTLSDCSGGDDRQYCPMADLGVRRLVDCCKFFMILNPQKALGYLGKMASTNLINYSEITLRLIAGVALWRYSEFSKAPELLHVIGLFLAFTAIVLFLVPRKWHAAYAVWWSRKLSPAMVRLSAPFSLVAGGASGLRRYLGGSKRSANVNASGIGPFRSSNSSFVFAFSTVGVSPALIHHKAACGPSSGAKNSARRSKIFR